MTEPAFKRILLKLSGEALMGELPYGTDLERVQSIAREVRQVHDRGVRARRSWSAAGNILRGAVRRRGGERSSRATADYMGMLATVLNARRAAGDAGNDGPADTRLQSAISGYSVAEPFIRRRAIRHLEKGRVVILAAGTGNPFFTTDTAPPCAAHEIDAEVLLKATRWTASTPPTPKADAGAEFIPELTHREALERGLKVMDSTALSLCMDNHMPIRVFDMNTEGNIDRIISGERVGTLVKTDT